MVGTGTSLPKAPQVFNVLPTYQGLTLVWQTWKSAGGTPVRGYFVHRYLDGQEKTQWVDPAPDGQAWVSVADPSPKPGTEYALSIVNEIGEGPTGPRVKATRPAAQIALTDGKPAELLAAGLAGYVVPFVDSLDSVKPKEAVTSAPDGRSLAYVTSGSDKILWTQRVQPSDVGVPVKLWTSPTVPALHRYTGVLYDALDIGSLRDAAAVRARRRLAVTRVNEGWKQKYREWDGR